MYTINPNEYLGNIVCNEIDKNEKFGKNKLNDLELRQMIEEKLIVDGYTRDEYFVWLNELCEYTTENNKLSSNSDTNSNSSRRNDSTV